MASDIERAQNVGQPSPLIVNYVIEFDKDNESLESKIFGTISLNKQHKSLSLEEPRCLNKLCHENQPKRQCNSEKIPDFHL